MKDQQELAMQYSPSVAKALVESAADIRLNRSHPANYLIVLFFLVLTALAVDVMIRFPQSLC